MLFTSYAFLFFFLPLIIVASRLFRGQARNLCLVITSFAFYGWWRADFMLLFIASSIFNYHAGSWIARRKNESSRIPLTLAVTLNLAVLAYFKYANFGVANWNALMSGLGWKTMGWETMVLPVGISFYTFQAISYLVDVHRKTVEPAHRWTDFACYLALFTHVAGPIVRYVNIIHELKSPVLGLELLERGAFLFMTGFCKKVLIANNVAIAADAVFDTGAAGAAGTWIGLASYALQIYFDFSGYSDMAIGLGYMIGFKFPVNFDSPYQATSITNFWRRWHITLSNWLRDYLYFPLGGSRQGLRRTCINLIIVMLLGGLWHGANWTFVVWGAYHGIWLAIERWNGGRSLLQDRVPAWLNRLFVLLLILLSWIPFRVGTVAQMKDFVRDLLPHGPALWHEQIASLHQPWFWFFFGTGWLIALFAKNSNQFAERKRRPWLTLAMLLLFLLALHELASQELNPFLYFQF
ncbi:MAG: MBOAT family O-acyltransferase [Chthoniobacterales bacterium]